MSLLKRFKKTTAPAASDPSVTPAPAAVAGLPPQVVATQDFEVVVRQLINQMTPPGTELVETGNDSVKTGDHETYLGNLRKGWDQRPAGEREVWLRDALHGMLLSELRDTSTLDLSMLRPGIRSEWYLSAPMLMTSAQNNGKQVAHGQATRPLGQGLARVLLWDTPTTMAILSDSQIAEWGSDFDQLWDVAVQNLANDPAELGWGRANDCCWLPVQSDDYTAERLFIDGYLDVTGIAGEVVMFHPTRETLIIVDPNDAAGLELAAKIAMSRTDGPNPVTFLPYIGRGLSWRPLELPPTHPAAEAVTQLRLKELASSYSQQKELLSAIHGEDLFVATYMVYNVDDRIMTLATWTDGAVSLLPRADVINFVYGLDAPEPQTVMVPWDAAHQILGDRLEPTAYWPERWRVTSFPTPAEIDQLRALAMV